MPIPKPNKDESKQDFISRCMGDSIMNTDYPDQKQRAAICVGQFKENVAKQDKQLDEQGRIIVAENVAIIFGCEIDKVD